MIVTICRKPLSGTVAANVEQWQTGGVNVDGCRIGTTKDIPWGSPKSVAASTHTVSMPAGRLTDSAFDPNIGRWPANFILQHSAECTCAGEIEVKSQNAVFKNTEAGKINNHIYSGGMKRRGRGEYGHANQNGLNTILDWDCSEGCPVGGLNAQSGVCSSTLYGRIPYGETRPNPGKTDKSPLVYGAGLNALVSNVYSDSGGAARFFKQVK